jgi:hypothetical protein
MLVWIGSDIHTAAFYVFGMVRAGIETHQICCWQSWSRVSSRNPTTGSSCSEFTTLQVGHCSVLAKLSPD